MAVKKKSHGGLKAFLLLTFIILLGLFSISYASTDPLTPGNGITSDGARNLFTYYNNLEHNYLISNYSASYAVLSDFCTNADWNNIATFLNNNIDTTYFPYLGQITFIPWFNTNYSNRYYIALLQNNNSFGDSLSHGYLSTNEWSRLVSICNFFCY